MTILADNTTIMQTVAVVDMLNYLAMAKQVHSMNCHFDHQFVMLVADE